MATLLPDVVPADLAGALDELGIDYRIRGDEAVGLCPAPDHHDTKPSWSMNLETGKHHCFSCGFGGSFQWLVQITKGQRAGEAIAWIKTRKIRLGVETQVSQAPQVQESDLWPYSAPPLDALLERDVTEESCFLMEVCFDTRNNRWIFPLRDPWNDRLIGWQAKGRGEDSHLVLNVPSRVKKSGTVFGYKHLKSTGDSGPVVVVENPIKAVKFVAAGFPRVVATCGASFVDYQINDLLWPVADSVIFALDNDKAGHCRVSKYIQQNPYARDSVHVFNYGNVTRVNGAYVHHADDTDPGDYDHRELLRGIETSTPAVFTYFEGVDWL